LLVNNLSAKKKIIGIVAARSGSKGLKHKNLKKIMGKSITRIAAEFGSKISQLDKIIVSSDSLKILEKVNGIKNIIKLKRRAKLSSDNIGMLPVIKDALQHYETLTGNFTEAVVIIDPTSPLREKYMIIKALKLFKKKKLDLVLSVHKAKYSPYFSILEKKGNYFKISKNAKNNLLSRQSSPKTYNVNTLVWVYSRKAIFGNIRIPKKTQVIETPIEKSIDIDTQNDLNQVKFFIKKNN